MIDATAVPGVAHAVLDACLGREWRTAAIEPIEPIEPIEGTSNFVARLDLRVGRFALRVPRLDSEVAQVDRRSECLVVAVTAPLGIAPEVIICDPDSGVLITRWIEGEVWTTQRAREREAIAKAANLLHELHGCTVPPGVRTIDLARIIDAYLERIRGTQAELAVWCLRHREIALRRLADVPRLGDALCHCDVHHRNLIEGERLQLIDWEYAGHADALFDLASYASYHELDAIRTRDLLESYGVSEEIARRFDDWRWLFEYVWLLWLLATAARTSQSGPTEQMTRLVGKLLAHE